MSDRMPPDAAATPPAAIPAAPIAAMSPPSVAPALPAATVRRSRLSLIWLIPVLAALIAGFLGYRSLERRGPIVTLHFRTGDGLTAGQTRVRHKAVELGVVDRISLTDDLREVLVRVRMTSDAEPYLTDRARFWVVRPRFSGTSISGIETLVSGAFIEMDPGDRSGAERREFTGLEQPPGVRSDEPGHTFTLRTERLGSLGAGAPVFFRDVPVGEVLGYDLGGDQGPATLQVFIRAPFDGYVRQGTRFWSASGVSVQIGAEGFRVELASLQAVLSGGVAFYTPRDAKDSPAAADDTVFPLFHNFQEAITAGYKERLNYVSYFSSSVRGLAVGAPVEIYGIQVGSVTEVRLEVDTDKGTTRVRVKYEVQPERILPSEDIKLQDTLQVARRMVQRGMRAQLKTASYLTGQMILSLDVVPSAPPAELVVSGDDVVVPSQGGGLDNILAAASDIAAKLDRLPIDRIANSLDATLASVRDTVGAPELRQAIRNLQATLAGAEGVVRKADAGLTPLLNRLPGIAQSLQELATRASRTVAGLDTSYGANSPLQRGLDRALSQVADTARSIRLLADFLDRHPEALVRGRAGVSSVQ